MSKDIIMIPSNVDPSFVEGINDYLDGKEYKECPHKLGTFKRAIWQNAYIWAEENKVIFANLLKKLSQIKLIKCL